MMQVLSIWTSLEAVRQAVVDGKLGAFASVCTVLAGMLAAFSLIKTSSEYVQGRGGTDLWKILRPIVLLVLVSQFGTMVLGPMNSLVNVFTRDLAGSVEISFDQYVAQWGENVASINRANEQQTDVAYIQDLVEAADKGPVGRFFFSLWAGVKKYVMDKLNILSMSIGTLIGGIIFLMAQVLLFVQMVLGGIYLTVLGIIGPVVFAMAILPGFKTGIRNWIARYIQISMWVPLCYLMMYINLKVSTIFCGMVASGQAGLGGEWLMVALQAVSLASVAAVPKLAGMIVESTGDNGARSTISDPARSIARKLVNL